MAFSPQELQVIKYGVMNGKSRAEVEDALTKLRTNYTPSAAPAKTEPSYFSRVAKDIGKGVNDTIGAAMQGGDRYAAIQDPGNTITGLAKRTGTLLETGLNTAGAAAGAITSPVTEAAAPIVQGAVSATGLMDKPNVQQVFKTLSEVAQAHPRAAQDIQSAMNILSALGLESTVKSAIDKAPQFAQDVATKAQEIAQPAIDATKNMVQPVTNTVKGIGSYGSDAVGRIKTNVAAGQATDAAIKALPYPEAQQAVRNGLDIGDVKTLTDIADQTNKTTFQKLFDSVKRLAGGDKSANPIEEIGKPIVQKLKEVDAARKAIGTQLGDVAKTFGDVTTEELQPAVLARIQQVPGLDGVQLGADGALDFSNTTLASSFTSADRSAIQTAFKEAIQNGSGLAKHNFRTELFKVLDGQKRSMTALTDTQDKALNAIRQGISDVLESKSPDYQSLSTKYAQLSQPIRDMNKMLKASPGMTGDVLNMKAGLLARRLTSNAPSGPELRAILDSLDKVTSGSTAPSVAKLQDTYNILNRYYDIAQKTGLQGQVTAGLENVGGGLVHMVAGAVKSFAGETPAVHQKAIEAILARVLK